MSQSARNGWTSHGHAIPGVTIAGPRPTRVYRCGGTMLCGKCKTEAMAVATRMAQVETGMAAVENASGMPEAILSDAEWVRLAKGKTQLAITVTTEANTPDALTEAATQALTQSHGAPLKLEGIHQYVAPDKYMGGYKTGYAWTFTPLNAQP